MKAILLVLTGLLCSYCGQDQVRRPLSLGVNTDSSGKIKSPQNSETEENETEGGGAEEDLTAILPEIPESPEDDASTSEDAMAEEEEQSDEDTNSSEVGPENPEKSKEEKKDGQVDNTALSLFVTLEKVEIRNGASCDVGPGNVGDFYTSLYVEINGEKIAVIAEEVRNSTIDFGAINYNLEKEFQVKPEDEIILSGTVTDHDTGLGGDDDLVLQFSRVFPGQPDGTILSEVFRGSAGSCEADLHVSLSWQSSKL